MANKLWLYTVTYNFLFDAEYIRHLNDTSNNQCNAIFNQQDMYTVSVTSTADLHPKVNLLPSDLTIANTTHLQTV